MKTRNTKEKNRFCINCEFSGIVREPFFQEHGEEPLSPCPKCVLVSCKCNRTPPYYYYDNDRIVECPCREISMKIDRIKMLYSRAGIEKKNKWKFINNYEVNNKSTEDAKKAAYDIIRNFPNVDKGLFLWGPPGTGKTFLSSIILTEIIIRKAIEGKMVKISRQFFNRIKSTFNENSPDFGDAQMIEKEFAEVDMLVIDDFGVQRDSEWELETLYNLVDSRYEAQKFTIFTSNIDPFVSMKNKYDGRILSRITEMCRIMEISGADYRGKL